MRVLVTGSAGQLGCRLVRQLLKGNFEVRGTVLENDPLISRLDGLDVELMEGELTSPEFVGRTVEGVDAVIHAANLVGVAHAESNIKVNLEITRACASRADTLDRLIYVSSSGVFPNNGEVIKCAYHPVDEAHPKRPVDEYSLSKLLGEEMVEAAERRTGQRSVIVRPSHILSESKILDRFTVGLVCRHLRNSQQFKEGELYLAEGARPWEEIESRSESSDQPCSVVDLNGEPWFYQPNDARDVAHLLVCALRCEEAIGESFNAGAPEPFTFPEGAGKLAELTGQDVLEVTLPVRWRYDHSIEKAKRLLGYAPQGNLDMMMESAFAAKMEGAEDYEWESA